MSQCYVLLAHFQNIRCRELWFQTGMKDKARFIPIHTLQSSLGPLLSKALPAYHTLKGCDTTSAFSGIGKRKSWKVLFNDSEAQQQLASLGEEPLAQESQLQSCEEFVCSLYTTAKKIAKTDDARHFLFCQKNKTTDNLPPTSDCLSHHIKRANFQTYIWNTALCPMQNLPSPDGLWWKLENDVLQPVLVTKFGARRNCRVVVARSRNAYAIVRASQVTFLVQKHVHVWQIMKAVQTPLMMLSPPVIQKVKMMIFDIFLMKMN